jgi:hypothetical protein
MAVSQLRNENECATEVVDKGAIDTQKVKKELQAVEEGTGEVEKDGLAAYWIAESWIQISQAI